MTESNPFGYLKSNTPDDVSMPGQCKESPDTRHHWQSSGIGVQSNERFQCKHCGLEIVD